MGSHIKLKDEWIEVQQQALKKLVSESGKAADIVQIILPFNSKFTAQHIDAWKRARRIPPEYALYLFKKTGGAIHPSEIAPHLYPQHLFNIQLQDVSIRNICQMYENNFEDCSQELIC